MSWEPGSNPAAASAAASCSPQLGLETMSDEELRAIHARAAELLAERKVTRRREALATIKELAREFEIELTMGKPRRKRGRPRKADTGNP